MAGRSRWLALGALALATTAEAPVGLRLPITVGGRTIAQADGSLGFGWPGTYFAARFRGPAVRVWFRADADTMRVLIDRREVRRFVAPGAVDTVVDGLSPAVHEVRLEKLTESQQGGGSFIGFSPLPGSSALPPPRRVRQIEFLGDSYTVGYGNTSSTTSCTRDQVHDRTDTQQAFGPLAARALDADYRVIAYSGFGIVRNYDGNVPELSLPAIYDRARPDGVGGAAVPNQDWRPAVIVINLGTNDFSTPLHAGERWKSAAALRAAYRQRYVAFVRMLAARQPRARFVLMASPLFAAEMQAVAATLNATRAGLATPLVFDGLTYGGCDSHPSLADDRVMATLLTATVRRIAPGWAR